MTSTTFNSSSCTPIGISSLLPERMIVFPCPLLEAAMTANAGSANMPQRSKSLLSPP
jgi:hypothetical protein